MFRVEYNYALLGSDYSKTKIEFRVSPCITFFYIFHSSLGWFSSSGRERQISKQLHLQVMYNGPSVPPFHTMQGLRLDVRLCISRSSFLAKADFDVN